MAAKKTDLAEDVEAAKRLLQGLGYRVDGSSTSEALAGLRARYEGGQTIRQVAASLGLSMWAAYCLLTKARTRFRGGGMRKGAKLRDRSVHKFDWTAAFARHAAGERMADIARDYGVTEGAVRYVVRRMAARLPDGEQT